MIDYVDVYQGQRLLQRTGHFNVPRAGLHPPGRMVVAEDDTRRIAGQGFLDHLASVNRGVRQRAAEQLPIRNQPMLRVQHHHAKALMLQPSELKPQEVAHGGDGRQRDARAHAIPHQLACCAQDFLRTCGAQSATPARADKKTLGAGGAWGSN
jgi:hypothetical protein